MSQNNLVNTLLNTPVYYAVMLAFLLFIERLFSSEIGLTLLIILAIDGAVYLFLQTPKDFNTVAGNSQKAWIIAVGAFVAVTAFSILSISLFQATFATKPTLETVIDRIATTVFGSVSTKPLANSTIVGIFVGGIVLAIAETKALIGRMMELLARILGVSQAELFRLTSLKTIGILFVMSTIFVLYHLQVKGVNDNVALLTTFIFAMASGILILKTREMESAVYLHITNNTVALVAKALGIVKTVI